MKKTIRAPRSSQRAEVHDTQEHEAMNGQDAYQISLPQISLPRNYTPFYVVLLIVLSFLLGALTVKSQYLEKNGTTLGANAPAQTQPAQPIQQPQGPAAKVDVANGHFPVLGQDSAKVTIVEFADLRCPFCQQFYNTTFPQIKKEYIDTGKAKFYWRHYDFLGPASVTAANGVECANEQNKFWDMHNYLYEHQPSETDTSMYATDKLTSIATDLGLNADQFKSCLDGKKYDKNVSSDLADGQKAGVNGTPTFFVNGNSLVGAQPFNAFKTIIDQELAK